MPAQELTSSCAGMSFTLFFRFGLYYGSVGSIFPHACNALFAAIFFDIALTDGNDLAVSCFEAESEFAGFILVYLKLRISFLGEALYGLVLEISDGSVFRNACDAVSDACKGVVDLAACGDDFAVTGFKSEGIACFGIIDNKFSHDKFQHLSETRLISAP